MKTTKHDQGKPMVQLITPAFLIGIANVLTFGASKYGISNWKKGIEITRLYGSCLRHLLSWAAGQDNDPESGLPHLDHAAINIMMMRHYQNTTNDNRFEEKTDDI